MSLTLLLVYTFSHKIKLCKIVNEKWEQTKLKLMFCFLKAKHFYAIKVNFILQSELNYLLKKCKTIAFSQLPICFDNTTCISKSAMLQKIQ